MTRSTEEIERDVEATRGDLDRTLDALKEKLTPGQLIDELTGAFKGTGGADMVANLGAQVRDNPLALALVGAGIAWLVTGKGKHGSDASSGATRVYNGSAGRFDDVGSAGEQGSGLSDMAGQAADAVGAVKERVGEAAHKAVHALGDAAGQAGRAGHSMQRGFAGVLESEPLIVGAVGLAVGMAIGASMPSTPFEDRTFGAMRDKALETGKAAGRQVVDTAKETADAALQAAKDEADRQGLSGSGDGGSLVEKAEAVAKAGVEAGREALDAGRGH